MKNINKVLLALLIFTPQINALEENSNFSDLFQDVFYYDKQNEEKINTDTGDSKIQDIKNANNEDIRAIIVEHLHNKLSTTNLNISIVEQEQLVDMIMEQKILNNNKVLSSISENNRITFDLINQFFDQYIVNNDKNVFIGQQTTKTNYGKFISYGKTKEPILGEDEGRTVFITPIEVTNTVNIPLNILGSFIQECDLHFVSNYDGTPTNEDVKVFKYRNNKLNWFRLSDSVSNETSCTTLYGTKNTVNNTCTLLNSHGTSYKEKILIPGMAYVYVPLKTEDYQVFDGTTTTTEQRLVPESVAEIKPCPTTMLVNGNTSSPTLPTNTNGESCYHYFDYIKYIINYDIDLLSGRYTLEVKENRNPFAEDMQNFLMPTKLFNGEFDNKTTTETVTLGTFENFSTTTQKFIVNGNEYGYETMESTPLAYVFHRGDYSYTVDRTTNVTTRKLETTEDSAQIIPHASNASDKDWYTNKLLAGFDTKNLENLMNTAVKLEGNIVYNDIPKYGILKTTDCANTTFNFKLNLNALISNLLEEKYYKISKNDTINTSGGCDLSGYVVNASLGMCVKKDCLLGYYDGNDGFCYKEEATSLFGQDLDKPEAERDVYNYLDLDTL